MHDCMEILIALWRSDAVAGRSFPSNTKNIGLVRNGEKLCKTAELNQFLCFCGNSSAAKITLRLCVSTGERYDFVITADQPVGAFWIQLRGLGECGIKRSQQLGILRYARGPYQPATAAPTYDVGIPQGVVSTALCFAIAHLMSFSHRNLSSCINCKIPHKSTIQIL